MGDRRATQRKHTLYYSQVFDKATETRIGFTIDVSNSGLQIIAEKPLVPGHILDLRLELSRPIRDIDSFEFSAEVRWCHNDISPGFKAIGMSIPVMPEDLTDILGEVQNSYCFDS